MAEQQQAEPKRHTVEHFGVSNARTTLGAVVYRAATDTFEDHGIIASSDDDHVPQKPTVITDPDLIDALRVQLNKPPRGFWARLRWTLRPLSDRAVAILKTRVTGRNDP